MRYLILCLLLLVCCVSYALDIDEAYRLIPHQQTPFIKHKSTLPTLEADYVEQLLSLAELAMVERVKAQKYGPKKSRYKQQINSILQELNQLKTPKKLIPAYGYIQAAIKLHRNYFDLHALNDPKSKQQRRKLIKDSSRYLIAAYMSLKKLYPGETRHNQQAFYDYLCALDFI